MQPSDGKQKRSTDWWDRLRNLGSALAPIVALVGLLAPRPQVPPWIPYGVLALVVVAPVGTLVYRQLRLLKLRSAEKKVVAELEPELWGIAAALGECFSTNRWDNVVTLISDVLIDLRTLRPADAVLYEMHHKALLQLVQQPSTRLAEFEAKVTAFDSFFRVFHQSWLVLPLGFLVNTHSDEQRFVRMKADIRQRKRRYELLVERYRDFCRTIQGRTGIESLGRWCYDLGPEV